MYIRTIQLSKLLVRRHGGLILNFIIKNVHAHFWRWGRGSFLSVFWCYLLEPGQVFILLPLKSDKEADTSFLKNIWACTCDPEEGTLRRFFFALAKPKHKSKETVSNNADKCRLFFIDTSVLSEIKNQFLLTHLIQKGFVNLWYVIYVLKTYYSLPVFSKVY